MPAATAAPALVEWLGAQIADIERRIDTRPAEAAAMTAGPDAVLLDNMGPDRLREAAPPEVPQDWMTLTLGTSRQGNDAQSVQTQLKQAVDAALAALGRAAQPPALVWDSGAHRAVE